MTGKEVTLSRRLKSLTEMVTKGSRVVDVGCDHGFLSIYLVQHGISPKVLAMDVRTGPLSGAREHIAEWGLEDYIETRLSDGLLQFQSGEADSLVCAGMGGRLMMRILTEGEEKVRGLKELILQPQSEIPLFRKFLRSQGYETVDENILCEEGKYYFLFKVRCGEQNNIADVPNELYDRYGKLLLQQKHPVLKDYLLFLQKNCREIENTLADSGTDRAMERRAEVFKELECIEKALATF